jgi:hypothetical protein
MHPTNQDFHLVLFAVAILLKGDHSGRWHLMNVVGSTGIHGQLRLRIGIEELTVFCMPNGRKSLPEMEKRGLIDFGSTRRVAVIYPHGSESKKSSRSGRPSAACALPTRIFTPKPTEVWLEDEMEDASDLDTLVATLERKLQA